MELQTKRKRGPKPKDKSELFTTVWGTAQNKIVAHFGGKEAVTEMINEYLKEKYLISAK